MKLLLFSDLHANTDAARRIVERAPRFDIVIGAGDFGNLRRDVKHCIDVLKDIEQPAILVAGNNESTEELTDACHAWPNARILHGTKTTIAGVDFFGIGGGIPVTPFGSWSYDFTEEQAAELLANCPADCVLVSHSPPKGAVDVSSRGKKLGSVAIRDTVLRVQPRLVVCGHIHESAGNQSQIGATPIVNAGPKCVAWELG